MSVRNRRCAGRCWRLRPAAALVVLAAILAVAPARAGDWKSRLSVRVGGGLGLLGWGDVETLKNSFAQGVRAAASAFGLATSGTCENPRLGWQGEVELQVDLNPRFGLGLAVGRYSRSGETVLTADWPPFLTSRHIWSHASAISPIIASAYRRFPLGIGLEAYIRAGVGFAPAVWKYKIRDEETIDFATWEQIEGTARDIGLLGQAGFGFEVRVAKRLTAFVEGRGQFLSLAGWKTEHVHSTDLATEYISGELWLAETAAFGGSPARTLLIASESRPLGRFYDGVRPVRLNFSGGIFLAGIRFKPGGQPSSSNPR